MYYKITVIIISYSRTKYISYYLTPLCSEILNFEDFSEVVDDDELYICINPF